MLDSPYVCEDMMVTECFLEKIVTLVILPLISDEILRASYCCASDYRPGNHMHKGGHGACDHIYYSVHRSVVASSTLTILNLSMCS